MSQLKKALSLLEDLVKHADEDCPVENRTDWFQYTIDDVYTFLKEIKNDDVS